MSRTGDAAMEDSPRHSIDSRFRDAEFPLEILLMAPQQPIGLHGHDFEELVVILSGSGTHLFEDKEYEILAGDVFTIKPGMAHGYPKTQDLHLVNILFVSSRLGIPSEDLSSMSGYHVLFDLEPRHRSQTEFQSRLRLNPSQLNPLMAMVDSLKSELRSACQGSRFLALTEFRRIIGYLSRTHGESSTRDARSWTVVSKAIRKMESGLREELSVSRLASASNASESTLLRAFKECTGVSPVRYLAQLRIQHACELLRNSGDGIGEVAAKSGFPDSNYFTRQFHRIMGVPPKKYRDIFL